MLEFDFNYVITIHKTRFYYALYFENNINILFDYTFTLFGITMEICRYFKLFPESDCDNALLCLGLINYG